MKSVELRHQAPWRQPCDPAVIYRDPTLRAAPYFVRYVDLDWGPTCERFFTEDEARQRAAALLADQARTT